MEPAGYRTGGVGVLGVEDLVVEILIRLGCSRSVLRSSILSTTWLRAARSTDFGRRYSERYKPTFLAFLVEVRVATREPNVRRRRTLLVRQESSTCGGTADAMLSGIDSRILGSDEILGCRNGVMLYYASDVGYYTRFPWDRPNKIDRVGPRIAAIPGLEIGSAANVYGQYGIIPAAGGCGMAFFSKEPADQWERSYQGVTFNSTSSVSLHVCMLEDRKWQRHISFPIPSVRTVVFHRNPYCVLVGEHLYMMYVLRFIVCFDIKGRSFSVIDLPGNLTMTVESWYEYTVGEDRSGSIVLVHSARGTIQSWVLCRDGDDIRWNTRARLNLLEAFGRRLHNEVWDRVVGILKRGFMDWYNVQVRSASADGRFVLLTVGFDSALYVADMQSGTVQEIRNVDRRGMLGRVFALTEAWPPKP